MWICSLLLIATFALASAFKEINGRNLSGLIEKSLISLGPGYHRRDQLSDFPAGAIAKALLQNQLSTDNAPKINVQIKPSALTTLKTVREASIKLGVLSGINWVNAIILFDGKTFKAKLRLKGLLSDHWALFHRASFKVRLKDRATLMGFDEFSLHKPKSRAFPFSDAFNQFLANLGLYSYGSRYVNVSVNGESWGLMQLEGVSSEAFSASNQLKESFFLELGNHEISRFEQEIKPAGIEVPSSYLLSDPLIFLNFKASKKIAATRAFREDIKLIGEKVRGRDNSIFDHEQLMRCFIAALIWNDGHALLNANGDYYFNPYTRKLQHLPTDVIAPFNIESTGIFPRRKFHPLLKLPHYASIVTMTDVYGYIEKNYVEIASAISGLDEYVRSLYKNFPLETPPEIESVLLENLQYLLEVRPAFLENDMRQSSPKRKVDVPNDYLEKNPPLAHLEHNESGAIDIFNLTDSDIYLGDVSIDGSGLDSGLRGYKIPPLDRSVIEPVTLRTKASGRLDDRLSVSFYSNAGESESTNRFSLSSRGRAESYAIGELASKATIAFLSERHMTIKSGVTLISKSIEFTGEIEIQPGARLYFCDECEMIVNGSLNLLGNEGASISLQGINGGWGGIYIIGDRASVSSWSYATVSSTRPLTVGEYRRAGGVTFYNSDIQMNNVSFTGSMFDDAVNIVQSSYRIKDMKVEDAYSDGVDFDYSSGELTKVYLAAAGGDGLDFSGGNSAITESYFRDIGDKAISAGEEARAKIKSIHVTNAPIGVASKDGSIVTLQGMHCEGGVVNPLATFSKKSMYESSAKIVADRIRPACERGLIRQMGSQMTLNGAEVPATRFDARSLYRE